MKHNQTVIDESGDICNVEIIKNKLAFKGASSLADSELLSLILGKGEVKEQYLERCKSILLNSSLSDIFNNKESFNKLSSSKAVINLLHVIKELTNRVKNDNVNIEIISNNYDAVSILRPIFHDKKIEEFWVISLNKACRVIDKQCISHGGLDGSIVDIRTLSKHVINNLASSVIIAHNHPSNTIEPSSQDIEITNKIVSALKLFDIRLLDHLIIGKDIYASFREKGLIV